MKGYLTKAFMAMVIIVALIGASSANEASAETESLWEIASDVFRDDLKSIQEWNVPDNAKSAISKIFSTEYKLIRRLCDFTNEVFGYIKNRFFEEGVSLDVYSSLYIDYGDKIAGVQVEDEDVAKIETGDGKIMITGIASGQTVLYINGYDRTDVVNITVKGIAHSVESYNVAVGETRKVILSTLTDLHVTGYRLSRKTILKGCRFTEESQEITFSGRKLGSCKIYLTTSSGKTIRITVKVVDGE